MAAAFDTRFPADALEFCPHARAQDIFVCGTYKLDERGMMDAADEVKPAPQQRRGQCVVFQVDAPHSDGALPSFREIQAVDLPAVLDLKWAHTSDDMPATLAIADSEGSVTVHEWREDQRQLVQVSTVRCAPPDTLCLALDWSRWTSPSTASGALIVSLSSGSLVLVREEARAETWHAHDYEPWAVAWDRWDANVVYSGGDDLKMKSWDVRQPLGTPIFVNRRFDAGVTSIQGHPHKEHILAVGSYDSTVRVFDTRKPVTPIERVDVGGGAWRVKWHPEPASSTDLAVACMHGGCRVVRFETGNEPVTTVRFEAHKSMAYGVDWCLSPIFLTAGKSLVGSCSFYDRAVYLWYA